MARTAPLPNVPVIPGMNPGVFILGGGAAGGGSGAGGGRGNGNGQGAGGQGGGKDASGGGKSADGNVPCGGGCGGPHSRASRGDPVDVMSGRVSSVPVVDFVLPGPLPLSFARSYDSGARARDAGFGFGWCNPLTWEIEIRRRELIVWDEEGSPVPFPVLESGIEVIGPRGWVLRRSGQRYELETLDEVRRTFEVLEAAGGEVIAVLLEVRDRNGNALAIERDGRALRSFRDSGGRLIEADRSEDGRVRGLFAILPMEKRWRTRLVSHDHDAEGNLVRVTDGDGFEATFTYDDDHRLTSATNRCGVTFRYRYDARGRCVETWGAFAGRPDPSLVLPATLADGITKAKGVHHHTFTYGDDGYTEVAGIATVERFMGSAGGRIDESDHGGAVVSRRYDETGYLVAFEDGLGAVTTIDRDARGRWLRTTDPLGRVTSCVRDAAGRIVEETDAAGGVRRTGYDARGNPVERLAPDGGITTHTYDERGLMLSWTEPNGATSRAAYDTAGNWIEVTLPGGATWRRTFDGLGRKTSETDPAGGVKRFRLSPRGDLLALQDEAGGVTSFTHDGEGHLTSETSPAGTRIEYRYSSTGKLHRLLQPTGAVFEIRYTALGAIAEVINENGDRHTQSWDSRGNLIEERTFDGRVIGYRHDLGDRLVRAVHEPSGATIRLSHDAAGRLVRRELPDGEVETYDYDALDRVVFAANRATECRLERDAAGRIVREEQRIGADAVIVETTYAATGEPVARRSSLGHVEGLEWSARGGLLERRVNGDVVLRSAMDDLGRERDRVLASGGVIQSTYDAAGRLAVTRVLSPEGAALEIRNQHHADGALVLAWDSRKGGTRNERDGAGRLVRVEQQSGQSWAFSFDAASNLFEGGDEREYLAGGRVDRYRGGTFRYDQEGRVIERPSADGTGLWQYDWTDTGRLRSVLTPMGERIDFVYDCFGRRLQKRTGRGVVRFVWDGDELLHEVRAPPEGGNEVRTYLFEPGTWTPVAHRDGPPGRQDEGARWIYHVTDAIGAPLVLVDARGQVVADVERSPWGLPVGGLPSPIGLPGQYLDAETRLAYHRFRYYDPEVGRFLSPDPLGLEGGADLYGYPPDPTRWDDPLGLANGAWEKVKKQAVAENRERNGGEVRCENPSCGILCVKPPKSTKGDNKHARPSIMIEWQADHIDPVWNEGPNTRENCQILCRRCNRAKSNKT